jgi:hypothetical protein
MKLSNPAAFNVDLAREVLAFLREHPDQHNQSRVLSVGKHRDVDGCTYGCVAGWTWHLADGADYTNRMRAAEELLGLPRDESDILFGQDEEGALVMLASFIEQAEQALAEELEKV